MNRISIILGALLVIAVGVIVYQNVFTGGKDDMAISEETEQLYTCGMHPDIITNEPGNCPICGMKLIPVKDSGNGTAAKEGAVTIDPVTVQNMNVKTAKVEEGTLTLEVNTNGLLQTDETKEYHVNARTEGWVENLYVNYTGQSIRKGEKLLDIYSPKLIAAQKEYIAALEYKKKLSGGTMSKVADGSEALIKAAHEKLVYFGMNDAEISELKSTSTIKEYVSISSPAAGTVINKGIVEGQKIMPGERLFHIANLSSIWVIADIYENEISAVNIGDKAFVTIPGYQGESFTGKVTFIYPTVNNTTHTIKIRIELYNTSGKLKPGMAADVNIEGRTSGVGPIIPESAVILSGKNNFAIASLGDGKFKPVPVELGMYASGKYRVLSGLEAGAKVVTSAQFLIDSESNLKAAMDDFDAGEEKMEMDNSGHNHAEENQYGIESPLIRTGVINVESIDENGDGILYECPMDWNIISDEEGSCPACRMFLEEFTIEKVKSNLDRYGYEYKK